MLVEKSACSVIDDRGLCDDDDCFGLPADAERHVKIRRAADFDDDVVLFVGCEAGKHHFHVVHAGAK